MALSPLPDRYFIFNFFEPMEDDEAFAKGWQGAADYVKKDEHFLASFLHKSSDPDCKYPWINFAALDSTDVCVFGKPDPKWDEMTGKKAPKEVAQYKRTPECRQPGSVGLSVVLTTAMIARSLIDFLPSYIVAPFAGFRELASYKGNPLVADKSCSDSSRYFVTGVKVSDSISDEDFEKNWKAWSGANFLQEKATEQGMEFVDSLLYRRFTTNMSPFVRYTVRTEVKNASDTSGHVISKEMNNRKCVEGVETVTAFCQVQIKVYKET